MKKIKRRLQLKLLIKSHIINNKKEYFIFIILFIIGIFLGVLFINNASEEQYSNVNSYINGFVQKLKSIQSINSINLLKTSAIHNFIIGVIIWFFGTTIIRYTNCNWNYNI